MPVSWTHSVCDDCWNKKAPGREPVRITAEPLDNRCCLCGAEHRSGIFVRLNPSEMTCVHSPFANIKARA